MTKPTFKLYPSAPLEKNDIEKRLEKKLNYVNTFNNHVSNIKEMITYFKDKNHKSKRKFKKFKMITTKLKSFDTFVIVATTSTSITVSITGIALIAIRISTARACGLANSNKVIREIVLQKYDKYKKQHGKDQQTIISFDKLYRKSSQDNLIVKNEYESFCNIFTQFVSQTKNESFY